MKHYQVLAQYNKTMNANIYRICQEMGEASIAIDQGAFFGSILNTLNHLLLADVSWLYRCTREQSVLDLRNHNGEKVRITGLNQVLYPGLKRLKEKRFEIDLKICGFIESLDQSALAKDISYLSSDGVAENKPLPVVLSHWFNHQAHHRGQITAMISQQGFDYGSTDLILMPEIF